MNEFENFMECRKLGQGQIQVNLPYHCQRQAREVTDERSMLGAYQLYTRANELPRYLLGPL